MSSKSAQSPSLSAGSRSCLTLQRLLQEGFSEVAYVASATEIMRSKPFLQLENSLKLLAQHDLVELLEETPFDWLEEEHALQIFSEDTLMPLTQLSGLRLVLRQPRFRSLRLLQGLEPFPRIKEDLLEAWCQVPVPLEALAAWAEVLPVELLKEQWAMQEGRLMDAELLLRLWDHERFGGQHLMN